jgi:hypothetical protein
MLRGLHMSVPRRCGTALLAALQRNSWRDVMLATARLYRFFGGRLQPRRQSHKSVRFPLSLPVLKLQIVTD